MFWCWVPQHMFYGEIRKIVHKLSSNTWAATIHQTLGHSRYDLWRTSVSYHQPHFHGFVNFLEPVIVPKINKQRDKIYLSQNLFCGRTFQVKFCVVSVQCGTQLRPTGSQWIYKDQLLDASFPSVLNALCSKAETILIDGMTCGELVYRIASRIFADAWTFWNL